MVVRKVSVRNVSRKKNVEKKPAVKKMEAKKPAVKKNDAKKSEGKEFVILFQGDSVTDAGRNLAKDFNHDLGLGYPYLISARLRCDFPEKRIVVLNRGISGNRSVDLYARWKVDALNLKPDLLSILIGVNDTWHEFGNRNGVELPRYEQFLRMLIEWTKQELPKTKIVLMEPFVLNFGAVSDSWLPEMKERGKIVKKLAGEYGLMFIPMQSIFDNALKKAPGEFWLKDGVHPTAEGFQLMADAWIRAVKEWI